MIPVSEPLLDGNEKKYLEECINTGWISSEGPFVKRLEDGLASFVGVKYGIAVCNGTAALETALFALGVKDGDEVIMPSHTIISCAVACIRIGAKPVLVDIDPEVWTMDVSRIEEKINPRTKVIMPVHIYGHPVDMDAILRLAAKYNIKVLEDAAEAQGAQYYSNHFVGKWIKCGSIGDIATTSFYANKTITAGEGGMVLTNNEEFARKARSYRNLCFKEEKRFLHTELGYNFRMSNLQAAVGLAQLEQIERFMKIKLKFADYYRDRLSKVNGLRFMSVKPYAKSAYWVYAVELDKKGGIEAEDLIRRLAKHGIGARPFFLGMHSQPALNDLGLFVGEDYPCTDYAARYGFYLPSGLTLTESKVDTIVDALKKELCS